MGKIKAIRSEADYNAALARIDTLMDAEPGTHEGEELDVLTDLVERYEAKHVRLSSFVCSKRDCRRGTSYHSLAVAQRFPKCSPENDS